MPVGFIGQLLPRGSVSAAPPCLGDPSPSGPPTEPTPVPLIPVCVACEAPGVAASVQTPLVQVRMNPQTWLVNLPT